MYIQDYTFKDNKIEKDNLSNKEIIIHNPEWKERLSTIMDPSIFGHLIGNLVNVDDYIQITGFKNTPKKFDLIINDLNDKKVVLELPFDNKKNKYKIIEEELVREYNINCGENIDIKLNSIEFKKGKNSFKKSSISNATNNTMFIINDHIGFINLISDKDNSKDEEKIKDLILNSEEAPSTEELYLKIKNNLHNDYSSIQLLYKRLLQDIGKNPDEIREENGKITKFLVTRNDKQYDLTNEIIINQLHTKK